MTILAEYQTNSFQFLSVCHYITAFGIFFYNKELITLEEQNQTVAILNILFEYLKNSTNESETKLQLLRKILKGSDLYGGRINETLDMKYVNETYQYIISKSLFSHYGNINGYLAGIINNEENLTYSVLKENVFQHLLKNYTTRNYCSPENSSVKLTLLSIEKIFANHIWLMFPEPEKDMNIIDVDYIYAMVGLKIVRSISDIDKFTFDNYILIAREINFNAIKNETEMINQLFLAPALFFYAYSEKEKFHQGNITSNYFLKEVYEKFFSYLKLTVNEIINEKLENSLHHQLQKQMDYLKSRTQIALELILKHCYIWKFDNYLPIYVFYYKTFYHWIVNLILGEKCRTELPDLDEKYREQFANITETYNEIEKRSIENVLINGDLINIMNSSNVVVKLARPGDYQQGCNWCSPKFQTPVNNTYLIFAIIHNSKTDFYAIKQENGSLLLLKKNVNEKIFYKELGINRALNMETVQFFGFLKRDNENANVFIQNVADKKTKGFVKELYNYYNEPTFVENVFNIITAFIPFYNCAQYIRNSETGAAVWSCSLDVISFVPVVGLVGKYSGIFRTNLIADITESNLISNSISVTTASSMSNAIGIISRSVIRTVIDEIISIRFVKDFTVSILRSLDPGFEITYQIQRFNLHMLDNIFQTLRTNYINVADFLQFRTSIESILNNLRRNTNTVADQTGLVPHILIENGIFDVVQYSYPGGRNFFGPRCVRSFGRTAELRSIENNPIEISVIPVEANGVTIYRKYSPETGELSDEFKMGNNDMLQKVDDLNLELTKTESKLSDLNSNANRDIEIISDDDSDYVLLRKPDSSKEIVNLPRYYDINYPGTSGDIISVRSLSPIYTEMNLGSPDDILSLRSQSPTIFSSDLSRRSPTHDFINRKKFNSFTDFAPPSLEAPMLIMRNDYLSRIGLEKFNEYIKLLTIFKNEGLSSLRQNQQLIKTLRITIDDISLIQINEVPLKSPINLLYIEKINTPHIINYLKNLNGKMFYFNDWKLVTSDYIDSASKGKVVSSDTIVYYKLKIDQQYGIVDLDSFHENFQNQYIIHPEVTFTVKSVYSPINENIIILEMEKNPLTLENWMFIRNMDLKSLMSMEIQGSKRMECIENAAYLVSSNTPKCKFNEAVNLFKNYILKIENDISTIPTYDKLADDIYKNLFIPEEYRKYEINRGMLIDDVLFKKNIGLSEDMFSVLNKIDALFDGIYFESVSSVFELYSKLPIIRDIIRFEDYYVLYSHLKKTLPLDKNAVRRVLASTYRLSLRQCREDWIMKPITIYRLRMHSLQTFMAHISYENDEVLKFINCKLFSTNKELEMKRLWNYPTNLPERPILYQIEVKNQAGIANINQIIENENNLYIVSPSVKLVVDEVSIKIIKGQDVMIVKMHDEEISKEERMIVMVRELNELLYNSDALYS
ncbi:uncharacterized protein LOC127290120 [Leptopilina boulardi]|uniref:uncharacterized protein LOC127290120 n=1 Tax=Leptopilina boulardi TaxID=63433 RepID=UPI0021F645B1|nr:uncharacterized protein LOC127290120 [Leptopilina boulardi]